MLEKYATDIDTPIYLPLSLQTMNVDWLIDRCLEAKVKYGCEIFLFDHLHFLVDMQTKQNMSLNIGAFMRRLKQDIAVGMNVCPIIIAHQKGVARGEEPSLEDVRDSTFIAQEADNVIIVWRRPDYKEIEINEITQSNPIIGAEISRRTETMFDPANPFANRFAMVQIAKSRRKGTYRWKKAFQKVGHFLEEI